MYERNMRNHFTKDHSRFLLAWFTYLSVGAESDTGTGWICTVYLLPLCLAGHGPAEQGRNREVGNTWRAQTAASCCCAQVSRPPGRLSHWQRQPMSSLAGHKIASWLPQNEISLLRPNSRTGVCLNRATIHPLLIRSKQSPQRHSTEMHKYRTNRDHKTD